MYFTTHIVIIIIYGATLVLWLEISRNIRSFKLTNQGFIDKLSKASVPTCAQRPGRTNFKCHGGRLVL